MEGGARRWEGRGAGGAGAGAGGSTRGGGGVQVINAKTGRGTVMQGGRRCGERGLGGETLLLSCATILSFLCSSSTDFVQPSDPPASPSGSCHGLLTLRVSLRMLAALGSDGVKLQGGSPSLRSIPRSWPLKDHWTKTYGGKVLEVNGTSMYHFKYTPKMVKPVDEAIEYFKEKLRHRNVFEKTIKECKEDPKKLEMLLDKVMWCYDVLKRTKSFDYDIDPPAVKKERREKKVDRVKRNRKRHKEIEERVKPMIEDMAREWFDVRPQHEEEIPSKGSENNTLSSASSSLVHDNLTLTSAKESAGKKKKRSIEEVQSGSATSREMSSKKPKVDPQVAKQDDEDVEALCEEARRSFEDIQVKHRQKKKPASSRFT
eukprot:768801-Hanusia_phi.AAC.4